MISAFGASVLFLAAGAPPVNVDAPQLIQIEPETAVVSDGSVDSVHVAALAWLGSSVFAVAESPYWARVCESERIAGAFDTAAWVVEFGDVVISRGLDPESEAAHRSPLLFQVADTAILDVVAVLDSSLRLLAAYTTPKEKWVAPIQARESVSETFRRAGWHVGVDPVSATESSIVEVLRTLDQHGPDPRSCGQVFIRPRVVTSEFPARIVDGGPHRLYVDEIMWLLQVEGVITSRELQTTGMYWIRPDRDLSQGSGTPVP